MTEQQRRWSLQSVLVAALWVLPFALRWVWVSAWQPTARISSPRFSLKPTGGLELCAKHDCLDLALDVPWPMSMPRLEDATPTAIL
jgi:hypothetical protein